MVVELKPLEALTRPHKFGKTGFFHASGHNRGVLLPGDLDQRVVRGFLGRPEDDDSLNVYGHLLTEVQKADLTVVAGEALRSLQFMGGRDYGLGVIGGDLAETRVVSLDGVEREVLIIPHGKRRAEEFVASFELAGFGSHPLANDSQTYLSHVAKVMALSGFDQAIYHRPAIVGNSTSSAAIREQDIPSTLLLSTWQFGKITPYQENPTPSMILRRHQESIGGGDFERLKHTGRYHQRLATLIELMKEFENASGDNPNEVGYGLRNGLLADTTCTNLAYVGSKGDNVVVAFPKAPSQNDQFFQGKTQAVLHEVLTYYGHLLADGYSIIPIEVNSPEQLKEALGSNAHHSLTGDDLMTYLLAHDVQTMIGPGTYRGPQVVRGVEVSSNDGIRLFETSGKVAGALRTMMNAYNNISWGLNGGSPYANGPCLSADSRYCTLFDLAELRNPQNEHEVVNPLSFSRISG